MTDLATQEGNDLSQVDVPATPEPSMADTMRATMDGIRERNAAPDVSADIAAPAADRTRGPDGKFAKALDTTEIDPAATNSAQADPANALADQNAAPSALEQPQSTVAPPSSWTAAAKAEFAKASPVVQQEVLRREQQMHDGIAQYKEKATYAESIQRAIAPFEQTIRQYGISPDVAVTELFKTDQALRAPSHEQRLAAIHNLAKHYQIDLSQNPAEQAQIDPNMQYALQELQSTKQQLDQFVKAQQQREQSELNSQIEQAKQGKEHFDTVRNEMAALLQVGSAKTIDEAYDMAVYARPDLRQALLAKQREEILAAENQKRAEEAKKSAAAAQAAKAAAATNVARRGTLPAQRAVGTMQDTMREKLEEIRSR